MTARIEDLIISNLSTNPAYCSKAAPHLRIEYFHDRCDAAVIKILLKFFSKYHTVPTKDVIDIEVDDLSGFSDKEIIEIHEKVSAMSPVPETNVEWLLEESERFCKNQAVYNALLDSVAIVDGRDTKRNKDAIPSILTQALAVAFDSQIGHDYINDAESRYEYYHRTEARISTGLEILDKILRGGWGIKSLNILVASTGVGKSLIMCHQAAQALMQGKNVLYITLEMAEERIAERIDANLMNITLDDLLLISKDMFVSKFDRIKSKTNGQLMIKEYPTGSAHAGNFRALLEELRIKKGFKPDFIIIDYLNICSSERLRMGSNVNTYVYIKGIAEELRALSVEFAVPILSASQLNRNGYDNTDASLSDVSESFGLASTCDFMMAVSTSEQLDQLGQYACKQLKNRFSDLNKWKRFLIGVLKDKMQLHDLEASAQNGIHDANPVPLSSDAPVHNDNDESMWSGIPAPTTDFSTWKFGHEQNR